AEAAEVRVHAPEAVRGREFDGAGVVEVEPERAGREGREHGCSFIGGRVISVESTGWGRRGWSRCGWGSSQVGSSRGEVAGERRDVRGRGRQGRPGRPAPGAGRTVGR